jgi:hypothetical protein
MVGSSGRAEGEGTAGMDDTTSNTSTSSSSRHAPYLPDSPFGLSSQIQTDSQQSSFPPQPTFSLPSDQYQFPSDYQQQQQQQATPFANISPHLPPNQQQQQQSPNDFLPFQSYRPPQLHNSSYPSSSHQDDHQQSFSSYSTYPPSLFDHHSNGTSSGEGSNPISSGSSPGLTYSQKPFDPYQPSPLHHHSYSQQQQQRQQQQQQQHYSPLLVPDASFLQHSSYPRNLPSPTTLFQLVDVFFTKVPTVSKIIHRHRFMVSLTTLNPSHPAYPHPAVLHAIVAIAARHSGIPEVQHPLFTECADGKYKEVDGGFGGKHAAFARREMEEEFKKGERLFDTLVACVILANYDYQNALWVSVWLTSALCTRLSVPLGVNMSSNQETFIPGTKPSLLPRTNDSVENEARRRVFWVGFMADRVSSCSSGWAGSLDEADVTMELPCRHEDFLDQVSLMSFLAIVSSLKRHVLIKALPLSSSFSQTSCPENPQSLSSPNLFTSHDPKFTEFV